MNGIERGDYDPPVPCPVCGVPVYAEAMFDGVCAFCIPSEGEGPATGLVPCEGCGCDTAPEQLTIWDGRAFCPGCSYIEAYRRKEAWAWADMGGPKYYPASY